MNIYGRKLVAFEIEGKRLWLNFYVCDVPYSVISVARLLQQGCKATLSSEGSRLEGPSRESTPVVQYHADCWVLDSANHTLTRLHKRPRATLFSPETQDRPVELKDLAGERTTSMEFDDGSKTSVTENWMTSDDPKAKQPRHFKGKTVFKLASQRTGRKLVGKQSTLKPPEPLESKGSRPQTSSSSSSSTFSANFKAC